MKIAAWIVCNSVCTLVCSLAMAVPVLAAPRLALWITDPIGATPGDHCQLPPDTPTPAAAPTLTEQDVSRWQHENGRWHLDPARFGSVAAAHALQDHCFVLAIDGKMLSSGVVLSSYSARLTGMNTLNVYQQEKSLYLQLTSGNHGNLQHLLYVDALNAVLGKLVAPATPVPPAAP